MMATAKKQSTGTLYCDFCGKSQHEVRKLIAGPKNFICDECVDICAAVVAEDDVSAKIGPTDYFEQRRFDRKAKHIFYACPFRQPFDDIYTNILKPAIVGVGWTIERADENFATGVVIRQVWEAINCCEVVVADVTDRSANVMYEIGMSHALHKPLMMVTQNENDVPFDLRHHRFVIYTNDDLGMAKLSNALCKMAATFDVKRTIQAPGLAATAAQ